MNHPRYTPASRRIIEAATAKNSMFRKVPFFTVAQSNARRLATWQSTQRIVCKQELRCSEINSLYHTHIQSGNAALGQRCFSFLTTTNSLSSSTPGPSASFLVTNNAMAHYFSTNNDTSPPKKITKKKKTKIIPRKAAISLTSKARTLFQNLLGNVSNPDIVGILLEYRQSSDSPRMVFAFDFVKADKLTDDDEGVSLEVLEDGVTPKPPSESHDDGLPKLYIHHNAFMKVLGCTVDVDFDDSGMFKPVLYDREGNIMDPNA